MPKLCAVNGQAVGRLAFGAEQLGGYEWGDVSAPEAEAAVAQAAAKGGILFDTADCYGLGNSERRLGAILKPWRRNNFLATKFGVRFDAEGHAYYDNAPDYAERALDASLVRLETDYVDLLQVHWPDNRTPIPLLFARLERFREDGRIRHYGVTNLAYATLLSLGSDWPGLATFSGQYSLLHRSAEGLVLRVIAERGLVFLSWGSLAQGLLSGKYDRNSRFAVNDRRRRNAYANFHGQKFERNLEIVEYVRRLSADTGRSLVQLALRFVLDSLPSSIAIVGVKRTAQFEESLATLEMVLSDNELNGLRVISAGSVSGC